MADERKIDEMSELAEFRKIFHYAGLDFADMPNRKLHKRLLRNNASAWFELAD